MESDRLLAVNDREDSVRAALAPLGFEEQRVVNTIGDAYFSHDRRWPTYQYVEAVFDGDLLDLKSVVSDFPTVGGTGMSYGALRSSRWIANLSQEQPIGLTLLGLHHYNGVFEDSAQVYIRDTFQVLSLFVRARRAFRPSPVEYEYLSLDGRQIFADLRVANPTPSDVRALFDIISHEPAFIGGNRSTGGDEPSKWKSDVTREVLVYEGVADMEEYLKRLSLHFSRPAIRPIRVSPSPRSLPAALDYLDTIWRLVHGRNVHLVRLPGAERTMLLGDGASTREEFLERLSTLGDILRNLAVPRGGNQKGGHALQRLDAYLRWKIPETPEGIVRALQMLDHIRYIRNAGTHTEAESEALAAYKAIGLSYPLTDWSNTWDTVREYTVEAIDMLREEVSHLAEAEGDTGPT
jgi:hypothetical protein